MKEATATDPVGLGKAEAQRLGHHERVWGNHSRKEKQKSLLVWGLGAQPWEGGTLRRKGPAEQGINQLWKNKEQLGFTQRRRGER